MNKKGFTLIELLAIIVILAVIMAIAIPQVLNVVNGSKSSAWKDNVKMMAKAIELNTQLFDAETGNYTYTVDSLCKNPSKVNELSKSSDTTVTCSNGVFTVSGTGQFDGHAATINCSNGSCSSRVFAGGKFCELKSGQALAVGSKYECDPGDGTKRNFYVLTVNGDTVDLIMENNLSDTVGTARTMTWDDAMAYFTTGAGASTKTSWKNVMNVDLPSADAVAKAVGKSNWIAANTTSWWCLGSKAQDLSAEPFCNASTNKPYAWLFDHLKKCTETGCNTEANATAFGYWTKDLSSNTDSAWSVSYRGDLRRNYVSESTIRGVRSVITVLKSNLN